MKSSEFITESTDLKDLTVQDVQGLQKKARLKIKEIFNSAAPFPAVSMARGGDGMRGLVFTFGSNAKQFAGRSNEWGKIAKKIESAFAKNGMKANATHFIWTNKGDLRAKPKIYLNVDLNAKLEDLYFATNRRQHFEPSKKLPHGAAALVKKVNTL